MASLEAAYDPSRPRFLAAAGGAFAGLNALVLWSVGLEFRAEVVMAVGAVFVGWHLIRASRERALAVEDEGVWIDDYGLIPWQEFGDVVACSRERLIIRLTAPEAVRARTPFHLRWTIRQGVLQISLKHVLIDPTALLRAIRARNRGTAMPPA
jgi:hypothetical protein